MINEKKAQLATDTEQALSLQPIAMVIPNRQGIYALSKISPVKEISYTEFLAKYADHPRPILVSFDPDGKSNPRLATAYGFGLDCWYIVV